MSIRPAAQLERAGRGGQLVVEGDLRLVGPAREREPDQHRDHDRVEHQHAHQQRRAAQDAQVLDQQPAHQWPCWWRNLDEGGLEVEAVGAHQLLELARGAVEEPLAVGQQDQLLRVAVGLLDVVGGVDDRGALGREPQDELPEPLALARVERRARLVEQQHLGSREQADRDVHALAVAARRACPPGRRRGRAGPTARASGRRCRPGSGTRSSRANRARFSATVSFP